MAYTHIDVVAGTPRTGEAVQWNLMGHAIEGLESQVYQPVFASISRSSAQAFPHNSNTTYVNFDTVDFQSQPGMADIVNDSLRAPLNGLYLITPSLHFDGSGTGNGTGNRTFGVNKWRATADGGSGRPGAWTTGLIMYFGFAAVATLTIGAFSATTAVLNAGDQISAGQFQTSGANQTQNTSFPLRLSMFLLTRL